MKWVFTEEQKSTGIHRVELPEDELLLEGEWLESQENGEYLLCGVATVEGERYHDFTIRFAPENTPASQTPEDILAQEWAWYEFVF